MGLFDQVVGNLAASALGGKGSEGGIVELVLPLLNKYPGGISGLIEAFQQGGLGEIVNSWISTGKNLPVSGEQLTSVLGNDFIGGLAKQLGVGTQEASGSLADILPGLIDQLTPNGQLPQGGDLLTQGLSMLKKGGLFG